MRIGLGVLRLAPDDFWNMTLAELTAAAEGRVLAKGGELPEQRRRKIRELRELLDRPEHTAPSPSIRREAA